MAGIFYLEFTDEISRYETVMLWASSLAANLSYFLGKLLSVFIGLYDAFFQIMAAEFNFMYTVAHRKISTLFCKGAGILEINNQF